MVHNERFIIIDVSRYVRQEKEYVHIKKIVDKFDEIPVVFTGCIMA